MKRYFIFMMFFMASSSFLTAQPCTPDPTLTSPGIRPDTVTNLPPATTGVPYQAVISAFVPSDTTYSGITATIDSICVVNVMGLPAGFSWVTDKPSKCWIGGQKGCMLISGVTNNAGLYPLRIPLMIYGKLGGMPISLPDTVKGYKINVVTSIDEYFAGIFTLAQAFPNPAMNEVNFEVIVFEPVQMNFTMCNVLGQQLIQQQFIMDKGKNTLRIDVSSLPEGIYTYTLQAAYHSITRKLLIRR